MATLRCRPAQYDYHKNTTRTQKQMALETRIVTQFAFVVSLIVSLQAQPYIQPPIVPINNRYVGGPLGANPYGVYGGSSGGSYSPMGLPYGSSHYPGNYGGYGPTLSTGGYGPTTAKPSYAYYTGYGNQNALSGYEGPYGGLTHTGNLEFLTLRKDTVLMAVLTTKASRAMVAATLVETGCTGADIGEYSAGSAYGSGLAGSVYSTYPYSPAAGNTPIGYNGYSGNSFDLDTLLNGYQPSVSTLLPTSYGLPSPSSYEVPPFMVQKNWAGLGYCQTVPEFMLSYCKASCGVCDNLGGASYGPYIQPSFGPMELNGDGYNTVFGSGLANNLYSTDLLNGPIDDFTLASSSNLSPAASSYYANLLANNPNYQLTSNDLALLNSLSVGDQTGQGIGFGGVNSGFGSGVPSSQFLPYNSGLYPYKSSIFSAQKKEPKAMALASNDAGISGGFGLGNSIDKIGSNGQLSTVVRMDELAGA
uniref:ShKT domain-containing protein n=1 Tax=Ditylenchus dipsaci TaxID=166011 RepID=A0A915E4S1_9BILA